MAEASIASDGVTIPNVTLQDIAYTAGVPPTGKVRLGVDTTGDPLAGLYYVDHDGVIHRVPDLPAGVHALLSDGSIALAADLLINDHALQFKPIATPVVAPPTGAFFFYLKSDQNFYLIDHSLVETQLTGVSGSAGTMIAQFNQTADVTVDTTITQTSMVGAGVGSPTLLAAVVEAGTMIHVRAMGILNTMGSGATAIQFELQIGGVSVVFSPNFVPEVGMTERPWFFEVWAVCRTDGVSGTLKPWGASSVAPASGPVPLLVSSSTGTAPVDTTGTLLVDLLVTWGDADPDNIAVCQLLYIELTKPS